MNRRDLKAKFVIIGNNDSINLYVSNETGGGARYFTTISLMNGTATIFGPSLTGKRYKDVDTMFAEISEANKGLKWPIDSYGPMLTDHYRVDMRIHHHLTEILGFKSVGWSNTYIKEVSPFSTIKITVKCDENLRTIAQTFGDYFINTDFTDENSAIAIIDTLIRNEVTAGIGTELQLLAKTSDDANAQIEMVHQTGVFNFAPVDFRAAMIDVLEKQIELLKNGK